MNHEHRSVNHLPTDNNVLIKLTLFPCISSYNFYKHFTSPRDEKIRTNILLMYVIKDFCLYENCSNLTITVIWR